MYIKGILIEVLIVGTAWFAVWVICDLVKGARAVAKIEDQINKEDEQRLI